MKNNIIDQHRFPATEALDRCLARLSLPEPEYRRAKVSNPIVITPSSNESALESSTKKKRSFDMADLLNATEPVEQAIAFPAIEWCRDGESDDFPENDQHFLMSEIAPLNDVDDEAEDDYFPSSLSSSFLGKRRRHNPLARSKSLRNSLCSLGEVSTRDAEVRSWGHFLADEVEMPSFSVVTSDSASKHKRPNSYGRSRREKMQLNFLIVPLAYDAIAS
jgi:hypothetical protein